MLVGYRIVPHHEVANLASVLTSLLTCDLQHVPTEVLGHVFFQQFQVMQTTSKDYIDCLRETETDIGLLCGTKLTKMCPEIFGFNNDAQDRCLWSLAKFRNEAKLARNISQDTWLPILPVNKSTGSLNIPPIGLKRGGILQYKDPYTDTGHHHYMDYIKCVDEQRKEIGNCIPNLENVCDRADIRAVKTVRLTMAPAAVMMDQLPNLHVIHLIRDPRAVVASRLTNPTYRSHYARTNLTREAKIYCDTIEQDLKIRQRIQKKYPRRIYELINEKFMGDKLGETAKVFQFMRKRVPKELSDFLVEGMHNSRVNSTKIISKWKNLIEPSVEKQIRVVCKNIFDLYGHFWPY